MATEIVLSGIRATGGLHAGNLLGAVRKFVLYQERGYNCLYFIADLHTLTTLEDPKQLRGNLIEIGKDYLAAGLKPEESLIYAQSSVPEISELHVLLSNFQPFGHLMSRPTIKEMQEKYADFNLGMLNYPVLMAADILGPQATLVPVGEDQVPNVELARDLARRFNDRFGETFAMPNMMDDMMKVPGLDGKKMGKSDADNAIDINAPMDVIRERCLTKAASDPERKLRSDPGDPYKRCPAVYPLHEIITPGETETREIAKLCQTAGIGCKDCKLRLFQSFRDILEPFQQRRRELDTQNDFVADMLRDGGRKAREIVAPTLAAVQEKIGMTIY